MSNTITYESLLNRALQRVSTGVDTSEGSFLFDAIAPYVAELYGGDLINIDAAEQLANMEIRLEDISSIKDEIISAIQGMNKGAVKKVTSYRGKITKIDAGSSFSVAISGVDSTKSSINVIKCSADLVIPYISSNNTVLFQNMSAGTAYNSIVYGFEIIEYY